MRNSVKAGARTLATGALLLLAMAWPVSGQQIPPLGPAAAAVGGGCSTEIFLYVEKSVSASTRETAWNLLDAVNKASQRPAVVTIYSFAGDVSAVNMAQLNVPISEDQMDSVLHGAAIRSPSDSTTDLIQLFAHVNNMARTAVGPPLDPVRRLFFIVGDFAHSPLSEQWLEQGSPLTAQLRQVVVTNRNVSLVAIQAPAAGPIASRVHQEVIRELGSNFLFFDDWASSVREVGGLLSDQTTPLGVNLTINPGDENPALQIANHTCNDLPLVTYSVRGDTIAPHVLGALAPPGLQRGISTAPIEVNRSVLRSLVAPGDGCVNLWVEAEGRIAPGALPVRRGMAPQPITLGNCAEITEAIFDLEEKVGRSEEFRPYEHLPRPPNPRNLTRFVAGLRVRGHWDNPEASLSLEQLDERNGVRTLLVRQTVNAAGNDGFNSFQLPGGRATPAFDGALRYRLFTITLPDNVIQRHVRRKLCLEGASDEPKRLSLTLTWAGQQATTLLIRRYPAKGDLIPHNEWESAILPILCLLVAAIFITSRLRPAHVGRFSQVLLALAAGLLVLGFATHFASRFGLLVEESSAQLLEEFSTGGVVLVGLVYFALFFMGFFDRRPSAKQSLNDVLQRRYPDRRFETPAGHGRHGVRSGRSDPPYHQRHLAFPA